MVKNALAAEALPRTLLGELTAFLQTRSWTKERRWEVKGRSRGKRGRRG